MKKVDLFRVEGCLIHSIEVLGSIVIHKNINMETDIRPYVA